MDEKITLDRETFKALAVDTRIQILKSLGEEYQLTLTDLSKRMNMAPSTISEHLERLVEVGLINQVEGDTKWKYYRLTDKGKKLLNPYEKRVWIILSTTLLLLFASLYRLISRMQQSFEGGLIHPDELNTAVRGGGAGNISVLGEHEAQKLAYDASTVSSTLPKALHHAIDLPYTELALTLLLAVLAGLCAGYLIKRKRNI